MWYQAYKENQENQDEQEDQDTDNETINNLYLMLSIMNAKAEQALVIIANLHQWKEDVRES